MMVEFTELIEPRTSPVRWKGNISQIPNWKSWKLSMNSKLLQNSGTNDFKIDNDLMQIYTEMGTHVSINARSETVL